MDFESGRSPGVPDRNGETSETGGYSDGKALSYSSCREEVRPCHTVRAGHCLKSSYVAALLLRHEVGTQAGMGTGEDMGKARPIPEQSDDAGHVI